MPDLYLLEPDPSPRWFPFADCRPVAELRAGAWLIRERWEAIADGGETRTIFGAPHLHAFVEDDAPSVAARAAIQGPALVGRSDFAPSGVPPELPSGPARLVNEGDTVGWWIPEGGRWDDEAGGASVELEGMVLHGTFDLLTALEHYLVADATDFTHEQGDPVPEGSLVIGDPTDVVILGALVEPGVTFDVRGGPVVLEQHAYVKRGSRLEGPVYIGPGVEVLGGDFRQVSVGTRCRVRGEIQGSVFLGYANKVHEGFVGHSVIGRWVNLGAGTTTSNLKNTYGAVALQVDAERIETGRQNLGTLFGDHAKTAIGTLFETGTVVGVGANVFGATRPPKYIPPFAWGTTGETMRRDGFLTVARRVMPRRQVEVTEAVQASLEHLYDHAVGT